MNARRRKKAEKKYAAGVKLERSEREYIDQVVRPRELRRLAETIRLLLGAVMVLEAAPEWLGFVEYTAELIAVRAEVLEGIACGQVAKRRAAWGKYLDLAQAVVDADEGDGRFHALIGLMLAEAHIWREAGEPVPWLRDLLDAQQAVYSHFDGLDAAIEMVVRCMRGSGELLQAQGRLDEAISAYIALEQSSLSDRRRGILNLRLADCYLELLDSGPPDPDAIQELAQLSVESAILYLDGEPEQVKAIGLLEALEAS